MDLPVFLLAFAMLWETSSAMLCYRCVAERIYDGEHIPVCENFQHSDEYVVECKHSTGCVKKETLLLSLGVTTKSVERGCAQQTMDGDQEKIDGHWQHVDKIHEAYEVGCREDSTEFGKPTRTTHCFCRGDLCNEASHTRSGISLAVLLVLWTILK